MKKDKEIVQEVLKFLVDLRLTWKQAMNIVQQESQPQTNNAGGDTYVANDEDYDDDEEYEDDDEDDEDGDLY